MSIETQSAYKPAAQGLYDPKHEHDACGMGFVAHIKGRKSHDIVVKGLKVLENLTHRGAVGADKLQGDGIAQVPSLLPAPQRAAKQQPPHCVGLKSSINYAARE